MRTLRSLFLRLLRSRGYDVRISGEPPRGFENFLCYARNKGLSPATVVDVGVGPGTPWLYEAFPDRKFVLIEALDVFEPHLKQIAERFAAEYHLVGVGEREETRTLLVSTQVPTSSSLLGVHEERKKYATAVPAERLEKPIPIRPLDRIIDHEPPYLLKIDVEGAELSVLRGAVKTLRKTQMVIAEISIMRRYEGEGSFAQVVGFMQANGFHLYDIPQLDQLGPDGPLAYIDAVFVPETFPSTLDGATR
jgi:FkbM family methyltransferase